jgi:hypothetical protein
MNLSVLADWARTHAYLLGVLAVLGGVLAAVLRTVRRSARRPPAAVVTAAFAALLCTAYSGDTSWRFARDHLGMASGTERGIMFGAAEFALFSMALMARQNLRTLSVPGTPGVLVWVVTGVQIIPAYSETGPVAGTVRAFFGPVCAALLWHLAMGIELRHTKPGEESQSLPAVLARELRERTLSRLGLARRGRDAAQITRDRWTRIATQRAARLADLEAADRTRTRALSRARRRLAVAVDRTDAGVLEAQRDVLLERIAAYRGAAELASMALPAPWAVVAQTVTTDPVAVDVERVPEPAPAAYPEIEQGVPAVPEDVPAVPDELTFTEYAEQARSLGAFPAAHPRTRTEVHAEYIPEDPMHALRKRIGDTAFRDLWPEVDHEPDDDSPPPPGEDSLTAQARHDFLGDLVHGRVPSIRALKDRYSVGQPRAIRIQSDLKARMS